MSPSPSLWRRFFQLVRPFWTSHEKWQAFGLLSLVVGLSLGLVFMNVQVNRWYSEFYDTLQRLDGEGFSRAIVKFGWLAMIYIVLTVYAQYFQQMLEVKWRRWLTEHFIGRWMAGQGYYRLQLTDKGTDNPDQRISEDVSQFVSTTLTLSLGLLRSVVTLASFVTILWHLSGAIVIAGVSIPGYMVWAAILYAMVGTGMTLLLGRALVGLNFMQQRYEANLRFGLVRVREHAESIALYRGEKDEQVRLSACVSNVVSNFWSIMRTQKRLGWFTSFWHQFAVIFPVLVAAPRFFAREISLGGLMQINSAFGQVYGALDFIISSFTSLATWKAVIDRLASFNQGLDKVQALPVLVPARVGESLGIFNLNVHKPDGTALFVDYQRVLYPGDRLLIQGPSGSGKSTLLRALAGLWPYAAGTVSYPDSGPVLFLSQKPYLPIGSLRDALLYPNPHAQCVTTELHNLLAMVHLGHLIERLDDVEPWSHILSLGEQQRIAFIRAFLIRPRLLFLDEATSALDVAAENRLYSTLISHFPEMIVVSVGHRESLARHHTLSLQQSGPGAWQLNALFGRMRQLQTSFSH